MNQDTCWCAGSQDTTDVLASDTGVLKNKETNEPIPTKFIYVMPQPP